MIVVEGDILEPVPVDCQAPVLPGYFTQDTTIGPDGRLWRAQPVFHRT